MSKTIDQILEKKICRFNEIQNTIALLQKESSSVKVDIDYLTKFQEEEEVLEKDGDNFTIKEWGLLYLRKVKKASSTEDIVNYAIQNGMKTRSKNLKDICQNFHNTMKKYPEFTFLGNKMWSLKEWGN